MCIIIMKIFRLKGHGFMITKAFGDKKIKIYALVTFALTVLVCALRTLCLAFNYDSLGENVGYYESSAALPVLFQVLALLSVLVFASVIFTMKNDDPCSNGKEDNLALKIVSAAVACELAAVFVISFVSEPLIIANPIFDTLIKISSLISIAYFVMNIIGRRVNSTVQSIFGFALIVWGVCVIAVTYFDIFIPLNSPDKIILHLAVLALMLFFIAEFRCLVDEMKKKLYVFSLCTAVFFSGVAAVPSLIKWFALGMNDYSYLYYDAIVFVLFLYSAVRLVSFAFGIDKNRVSPAQNSAETEKIA